MKNRKIYICPSAEFVDCEEKDEFLSGSQHDTPEAKQGSTDFISCGAKSSNPIWDSAE